MSSKRIQLVSTGKAPCKNCEERYPACHGKCEKFAEYRREVDRIAAARRKKKLEEGWPTHHVADKKKEKS